MRGEIAYAGNGVWGKLVCQIHCLLPPKTRELYSGRRQVFTAMTRSPTAHGEMIAGWELGNLRLRLRLESNSEVHHTDENDHTLHSDLESKNKSRLLKYWLISWLGSSKSESS